MTYEIEEEGGSIQFVTIKNDEGELVLSLEEMKSVLAIFEKIISLGSPEPHVPVRLRKEDKVPLRPVTQSKLSDWVTSY